MADEYMMNVKLRPAPTHVNANLGCPYEMVRNWYYISIFFLLTSGIVFRTLLGFRKVGVVKMCAWGDGVQVWCM